MENLLHFKGELTNGYIIEGLSTVSVKRLKRFLEEKGRKVLWVKSGKATKTQIREIEEKMGIKNIREFIKKSKSDIVFA